MIQKLIDAYELEREMYRRCIDTDIEINKGRAKWDSGLWIRYKVFEDAITVTPWVETESVKHGRWVDVEPAPYNLFYATCSVCGERQTIEVANFCPMCGASMNEVDE